jgi:hypothetical protein
VRVDVAGTVTDVVLTKVTVKDTMDGKVCMKDNWVRQAVTETMVIHSCVDQKNKCQIFLKFARLSTTSVFFKGQNFSYLAGGLWV